MRLIRQQIVLSRLGLSSRKFVANLRLHQRQYVTRIAEDCHMSMNGSYCMKYLYTTVYNTCPWRSLSSTFSPSAMPKEPKYI